MNKNFLNFIIGSSFGMNLSGTIDNLIQGLYGFMLLNLALCAWMVYLYKTQSK